MAHFENDFLGAAVVVVVLLKRIWLAIMGRAWRTPKRDPDKERDFRMRPHVLLSYCCSLPARMIRGAACIVEKVKVVG